MQIRPYQTKDFRYVQDICMATSKYADDVTPLNRALICTMYCDYYLDNQSDCCFVAVDDDDIPVGYVLCVVDLGDYVELMQQEYLPLIRKISGGDFFRYSAEIKIGDRYVRQGYTSHLHINVLPDYQRQGLGTRLIEALEAKLKELFVEGVYLVTGQKNAQARAFYEKLGYEDIDYLSTEVVYGKKFYTED